MNVSPTPTAEEINALPQNVQDYIHWLVTDADPASTLQRNYFLEQQNAQLRALLEKEFNLLPPQLGHFNCAGDYILPNGQKIPEQAALRQGSVYLDHAAPMVEERDARSRRYLELRKEALPQSVMQTQSSEKAWPDQPVDNPAIRQCMYRAEADFHKGSKSFLTKREQGHIMGLFRNVLSAFVDTITSPKE